MYSTSYLSYCIKYLSIPMDFLIDELASNQHQKEFFKAVSKPMSNCQILRTSSLSKIQILRIPFESLYTKGDKNRTECIIFVTIGLSIYAQTIIVILLSWQLQQRIKDQDLKSWKHLRDCNSSGSDRLENMSKGRDVDKNKKKKKRIVLISHNLSLSPKEFHLRKRIEKPIQNQVKLKSLNYDLQHLRNSIQSTMACIT